MDNPTKAQMWLTSIEKIFRYMKCPNDQKVQCAVFFLEDRGTTWWETAERMLGGDVSKITWEQFKEGFYAKFFSANVKYAKQKEFLNLEQGDKLTEKFVRGLRLDVQGIVRALRPTTHTDALHLALDLSLHEKANPSKAVDRRRCLRHRQQLIIAGRTLRELPACRRCGRVHGGHCLVGSEVCFRCKQPGHAADVCPQKLIETTPHQPLTSQQGKVFATTRQCWG
ncbi:gag-protease polyprotein [Cucumis melo var. makuwa]|uniref:Gag-protease polyprotein n=1 Tax=Cucumis melo var. makuwa TaxID=1194695 RepID=A0A5D3DJ48_CUCMM|nr:gag-protease polyprotein [Cucumis melo var. makuwa]TYK23400.1 gag-protease polyprotein [Cucumis melo var. makuwa]